MPSVRRIPRSAFNLQTATPVLTLRDARRSYDERAALAGVSIDLYRGQIYGLLGPNGAGKTTLMRAMSGYLALDAGSVSVGGRDPRMDRDARRSISYVPQNISIFPHLTVAENLVTFGRLTGLAGERLKQRVSEIIHLALLEEQTDQVCKTLSGGYQRRVNICVGVLGQPSVLILDEPTVGIDVDAREAIHSMLMRFREAGVSIVLATHDLEQAQALSDRVGMMKDGRLILEGDPEALIDEAFAGKQEVTVVLWQLPEQQGVEALHQLGLLPTQSPLNWRGFINPGAIDARQIKQKLTATGLDMREIRIREPDLGSLFFEKLGHGAAG